MDRLRQWFEREFPAEYRSVLYWISFLYFAEGFPFGIAYDIWPVYFRVHDVSLREIGLMSLLFLPYTLKTAWAPFVDRVGTRQIWIAVCQLAMAGLIVVLLLLDPSQITLTMRVVLLAFTTFSATQDIAIDAYAVDVATPKSSGYINGLRAGFYRVALIVSGGLFLLLPAREGIGWTGMWILAIAVLVVSALITLWRLPDSREPIKAAVQQAESGRFAYLWLIRLVALALTGGVLYVANQMGWPNYWVTIAILVGTATLVTFLSPQMLRWLFRPEMAPILAFIIFYKVCDSALGRMVKPFWVDKGYSTDEIGLVSVSIGTALSILGALVGGFFISKRGIFSALLWMGIAQIISNLGYVAVAGLELPRESIYVASVIESFTQGLGTAAFLSFLMNICDKAHGATQYAMLSAAFALSRDVAGAFTGIAAESLGYFWFFLLTAAFSLPAMLLLPVVRGSIREQGEEPSPAASG